MRNARPVMDIWTKAPFVRPLDCSGRAAQRRRPPSVSWRAVDVQPLTLCSQYVICILDRWTPGRAWLARVRHDLCQAAALAGARPPRPGRRRASWRAGGRPDRRRRRAADGGRSCGRGCAPLPQSAVPAAALDGLRRGGGGGGGGRGGATIWPACWRWSAAFDALARNVKLRPRSMPRLLVIDDRDQTVEMCHRHLPQFDYVTRCEPPHPLPGVRGARPRLPAEVRPRLRRGGRGAARRAESAARPGHPRSALRPARGAAAPRGQVATCRPSRAAAQAGAGGPAAHPGAADPRERLRDDFPRVPVVMLTTTDAELGAAPPRRSAGLLLRERGGRQPQPGAEITRALALGESQNAKAACSGARAPRWPSCGGRSPSWPDRRCRC